MKEKQKNFSYRLRRSVIVSDSINYDNVHKKKKKKAS